MKSLLAYFKRPNPNLKLVYESDLDNFLNKLGVTQELNTGNLTCVFCGKEVNRDNLAALLPKKGKVGVVCNKAACRRKVETDI